jgi:hypothetical protein
MPSVVVTDKLRYYSAAFRDIGLSARHEQGLRKNNRAENSHLPIRRRERKLQRFKSAGSFELTDFRLIFVPFGHYDEPETLRYAKPQICPIGADVRHIEVVALLRDPMLRQITPTVLPWDRRTSASRRWLMICSTEKRFLSMDYSSSQWPR